MTDIILPGKVKRMLTTLILVLDLGRKAGPGLGGSGLFTSAGSQWRERERRGPKGGGKQSALQLSVLGEPESRKRNSSRFNPRVHSMLFYTEMLI